MDSVPNNGANRSALVIPPLILSTQKWIERTRDYHVQIGYQSRPEQRHLPHLPVPVQFRQLGVHFLEPEFVGQVDRRDFRIQTFADLGHSEEENGNVQVATNAEVKPVDIFGTESRSPFDAYRVSL